MTEEANKPDIPKVVATAMVTLPRMALRLGIIYLRFKRKSRRAAKDFAQSLERQGMPPETAKKLGESYATEFSIRKLLSGRGRNLFNMIKS